MSGNVPVGTHASIVVCLWVNMHLADVPISRLPSALHRNRPHTQHDAAFASWFSVDIFTTAVSFRVQPSFQVTHSPFPFPPHS